MSIRRQLLRLGAVFMACAPSFAQEATRLWVDTTSQTLTVRARGEAQAPADVMYLLLEVAHEGATPAALLARHRAAVRELLAGLAALPEPTAQATSPAFDWYPDEPCRLVSRVLVTFPVADAEALRDARDALPSVLDVAAKVRAVPVSVFPDGG